MPTITYSPIFVEQSRTCFINISTNASVYQAIDHENKGRQAGMKIISEKSKKNIKKPYVAKSSKDIKGT